jgi:microcystin-dependent protein
MTDPFLAEIRMFAGNFAPTGWALCNGQLMSISQNTALFALLGTTYGGDGRVTFGLPNLQGSAPMQQGQGPGLSQRYLGEVGGTASVTLLQSEMPGHTHQVTTVNALGDVTDPTGARLGQAGNGRVRDRIYGDPANPNTALSSQAFLAQGGSQPHNNMPPYLTITFIIALQGIFPQRP